MTKKLISSKRNLKANIITFSFIIFGFLCIIFSNALKESILFGIKLSVTNIIPSVFPFFVISDYLSKSDIFAKNGFCSKIYSNALGLPNLTFTAFLIGNLCGFPIGAKCASELYENGKISSNECERLIIISTNPSLAFTVSAVGSGMLGSLKYGILLYSAIILSSVVLGLFTRRKCTEKQNIRFIKEQNFDFSKSIKNAGSGCLAVSSFIIFFSGLIGLLKHILKNSIGSMLCSVFLEVGNGVSEIIESDLTFVNKLFLLAFALGFSGLSVFLQTLSFTPKEISKKRIFIFKVTEGLLSSLLVFLLLFLKKK